MPVLCLAVVFVAFLAIFADGTVLLLKKISSGRFDTHFSEIDIEMRQYAFPICLSSGCIIVPALPTTLSIYFLGHSVSVILAIFFLGAHTIYRTLIVLSDIAARKHRIADNDMSRKKAQTARRWAFLILGVFAILIAAIITLIMHGMLSKLIN